MLYLGHRELGGKALVGRHQGHHVIHRLRGYYHTCGMRSDVSGKALQYAGRVHYPVHQRVGVVDALKVRTLVQSLVQRYLKVVRHHLGDLQRPCERQIHHPCHVLECVFGFKGTEGGYLRDVVHAITALYVVYYFPAALYAKVHVYIRHGYALLVEEALEDQGKAYRVYICYLKGVGHYGTCGRASAGAHHDAVALGVVYEVPDYEEVAYVAHLLYGLDLVAHAFL